MVVIATTSHSVVAIVPDRRRVHPILVVTAERVLRGGPNVVQVVPLTRTLRRRAAEVVVDADGDNGLSEPSSAQCQHVRSVATSRILECVGNVGPMALGEIRETLGLLLDL